MAHTVQLALRIFQIICTIIILGLVGNIIAEAFAGNPATINYDMFVAVFALLSLIYLTAATVVESFILHPLLMLIVDALNTFFFLIAGIATAAELGAHSCDNVTYTRSNRITNGSYNTEKRCRQAQAATAFYWFGFAAFAASTFIDVSAGHGINLRPGGSRRGPAMSQV